MNRIRKIIRNTLASIAVLSIAVSFLSVNAFATGYTEAAQDAEGNRDIEEVIEPFFEYDYDSACVYRYDDNLIPVSFKIAGLKNEQDYYLSVESDSLLLSKNYNKTKHEIGRDNYVSLELEYTSTDRVEGIASITVSQICITVSSSLYNTIPCTLTLFIIDSVDGTFVSYIDAEDVIDYYYRWSYENGKITKEQLIGYFEEKTMTRPFDESEDAKVPSSSLTESINGPKIHINYTIKPLDSGERIIVSGDFKWSDINGTKHPLRSVKVLIMDKDTLFDDTLGTVYTNSSGSFTVTFDNQTGGAENGGCDVYLKVFPVSSNIAVKTKSNGNYYFSTPVTKNVSNSTTSINQVYDPCDTAKAFYIHQAGIVGAQYVTAMSGSAPSNLTFRYPYSDSGSNNYNGSYISIKSSSYYSWDVILHEYGHFIQDIYNIEDNPGGRHYIDDNAIDTYYNNGDSLSSAKDKGTRLAWGEGWATYFSISAQVQQNVSSMSIPGSGDSSYDNLTNGWSRSLENYTAGKGEGLEMAVSCVLWDFADSSVTTGSSNESYDNVSFGFSTIWAYTISSRATIFDTFYDYVFQHANQVTARKLGRILSAHRFSASNPKTNGSAQIAYTITSSSAPTLSWSKANGCNCCADSYRVIIYSRSMTPIYSITVASTSYTLTNIQWNNLKSNYSSGFYWCVIATPSSTPATGPYHSQFILCTINIA